MHVVDIFVIFMLCHQFYGSLWKQIPVNQQILTCN